MKMYTFEVQDNVTRRVVIEASTEEEARQKLEDWEIVDEWEHGCDVDFYSAELIEEE